MDFMRLRDIGKASDLTETNDDNMIQLKPYGKLGIKDAHGTVYEVNTIRAYSQSIYTKYQ